MVRALAMGQLAGDPFVRKLCRNLSPIGSMVPLVLALLPCMVVEWLLPPFSSVVVLLGSCTPDHGLTGRFLFHRVLGSLDVLWLPNRLTLEVCLEYVLLCAIRLSCVLQRVC